MKLRELHEKGYIGNESQLVTIRRVCIEEGRARGTQIIEVVTAGGFSLDILPDRGLDLGQARYKGINMSWMSKNGYDSPAAFVPYENEFTDTFPGGLLYSCGLRSAGPPNRDGGEWHPLHGRIHNQAAEQVCARVEGDEVVVSGIIRETRLFGHDLEMRRTIRIPVWGAGVTVEDEISNLTGSDEELMQIYHCNFGYPLLSEDAVLELPKDRKTTARTPFAAEALGRECSFEVPVPGQEERCYFQEMKDDFHATLRNPKLGVAMTISWSGETLPVMVEWRSMAGGDYVLGLEPANCYIMGRHDERENGTLPVLKAHGTIKNRVCISFENV